MTLDKDHKTVTEIGCLLCHDCHLIIKGKYKLCPRCGAHLEVRLQNSFIRTLALLITATIIYIPANVYPIMVVDGINGEIASTIIWGIVLFFESKDYFVGAVIFIASILIPSTKLVGMFVILYSVKMKNKLFYKHRSLMFRFIQFIGRWSMLDIFVIAIMVSIVQFGTISSIHAGPGATSFGLVVVITMYAAITFDARLIWDSQLQAKKQYREQYD
jgi:paraquat-inducible protein A